MATEPNFASMGTESGSIDVLLSYKIVELFSQGLYTSPNKAVEELVANSFDAGAQTVQVILSPNLHSQDATIAVIDDGEGMDGEGLRQHWFIGISNKRDLPKLPRDRQQIGKFGIGKLATYVLSNRLTHITKSDGKYYSTSMDYGTIDNLVNGEVEPKAPIKIALRELTPTDARTALKPWTSSKAFRSTKSPLFGKGSSPSWTVSIMSSLKDKVHEIRPGTLRWVLRTALPLRPDFAIWLNGEKLAPSKEGTGLLKKWVLGRDDLAVLPKPSPKGITASEDTSVEPHADNRFGLEVPNLGRITGYAEVYKDLLTGKSDDIGRSHGFFVYVYGRLLNVDDGHFGISPNELRHGTFGRFRLVVHMDGLDKELRSNRESIGEGPLLTTAQDVLRGVFNVARPTIEKHDHDEEPGAKLARKLGASPTSLSTRPIVELSRAVAEGKAESRYLLVPKHGSTEAREEFLTELDQRAHEAEQFLTGVDVNRDGTSNEGIVRFDTESGVLRLNGWHPFVATFSDEFIHKRFGQPLELLAMAEVLAEAHLHSIGVKPSEIEAFLSARDRLLRNLVTDSGRQSALSIANALSDARNSPRRLEECVCDAFRSLGFDVTPFGKPSEPDGVATAYLPARDGGQPQRYKVSLEAKSKKQPRGKVTAKDVNIAAVVRHRDKFACDHAIVIGPAFPTSKGESSALGESIDKEIRESAESGQFRTITLITVDELARLVRLRPLKRLGLRKLRELFRECRLPLDSADWVESIRKTPVASPPYRRIVETIEKLQKKFSLEPVRYSSVRVELSHLEPAIVYEQDEEIAELCKAMAQMAPGALFADSDKVELDQSPENVIALIETATQEYPANER